MPMELEKHEDGCQCRKCAAAAASNWLCWVPILGQGCNTFPTARCSLSLHKISWKELFQGCGDEIGSDVKNTTVNKSPYPSHVLLSLLLCHQKSCRDAGLTISVLKNKCNAKFFNNRKCLLCSYIFISYSYRSTKVYLECMQIFS